MWRVRASLGLPAGPLESLTCRYSQPTRMSVFLGMKVRLPHVQVGDIGSDSTGFISWRQIVQCKIELHISPFPTDVCPSKIGKNHIAVAYETCVVCRHGPT